MIKVLVDSASDCLKSDVVGGCFIPMCVQIDGTDYLDGETLEKNQFYELLMNAKEFPKTSQPAPQGFISIFEEAKEKGDEIIYIGISSALSGTFQSSMLAKDIVDYDKIYLVDSKTGTHGIRIMMEHANKMIAEGKDAEAIVSELEELKTRIRIIAGLDTLEYLAKGGRLSKGSAAVGEIANIKPLVRVDQEGKVESYCKCIGSVRAIKHIMADLSSFEVDENYPMYTLFTYGEENVEKLESKLVAKEYKIKQRLQVGSAIGAHIGPGAYGVVFVKK